MNPQQQQGKSYTYLRKTVMECRDVLLKSETQARDKIAEWRQTVQKRVFETLREIERTTLRDLREIVIDQETKIAEREKQVEEMLQKGDQLEFEEGVLELDFKEVRYHAEDMFDEKLQKSLSLGSISLENVTIARMAEYGYKPSILDTQEHVYNEIPSMNNFESNQHTSSIGISDGSSEETHEYDICSENNLYYNSAKSGTFSEVYVNDEKEEETRIYEFESIDNTTYDDVAIKLTQFPDTMNHVGTYNHAVDLKSPNFVYPAPKNYKDRKCDDDEYLSPEASTIKPHEHLHVDREKTIPESTTMKKCACAIVDNGSGTLSCPSTNDKDAHRNVNVLYSTPFVSRHPAHGKANIDKPINTKIQTTPIEENTHGNEERNENTQPMYSKTVQRRPKRPTSMDLFGGDDILPVIDMDETGGKATPRVGIDCPDTNVCKKKTVDNAILATKITNWKTFHFKNQYSLSIKSEESCRFTVLPDGRLVLLFESEKKLTLLDEDNKHVHTLNINYPKAICNVEDDRVAVVQKDCHNETVILIEAKSTYLHIYDCIKIEFEDRTVDIKYRQSQYYLGCCNFKVYVCDEKLKSMLLVYCGDSSYLMISSDYNHVTNTYYTVNSVGSVNIVKDDKYDTYHVQGIAVCCHDDKAYVLCDQGKKVVELFEQEVPRQREVIQFKGTTPVDMCISSNGAALFVLFSDTKELTIEIYEIRNNSLNNMGEKDKGHQRESLTNN